jgi:hypothetical protein
MKVLRSVSSGQALRHAVMRSSVHRLEHARAGVLERNVEVGQDAPFRHQRDDLVHVRVRVDVMQPYPGAQLAQPAAQVEEARLVFAVAPAAGRVLQVRAVGAGVLRDDEQLLHPGLHQLLALGEHLGDRAAGEPPAHGRDDAEAALVVAALGDLQVRVMPRRELDALRRQQVEEGIVRGRHRGVHRLHHPGVVLRLGDGQHLREFLADDVALRPLAKAARDDDLAVLGQRLADGPERLLHGGVDEAAGVDQDHVGLVVAGHGLVALGPQLREDPLGIHQRLGTAQGNEAHARRLAAAGTGRDGTGHCTTRGEKGRVV